MNKSSLIQSMLDDYQDSIITETIPSKTILLREGDVSNTIYLVKKGAVRLWNNDDGRDITVQFFFENQFVSSFESFYLKKPSQFSIEVLEETIVGKINRQLLEKMDREVVGSGSVITELICERFIEYTNYFLSRIKNSPEKRYEELLKNNPELIERVPHHYIASYLGMTPVSLSRIRTRKND